MVLYAIISMAGVCFLLGLKKPGMAMAYSLLAVLAMLIVSGHQQSSVGTLLSFLVLVAALVAIVISRGISRAESWPHEAAKWILGFLWVVAGLGIGFMGLVPYGFLFVLAFVVLMIRYVAISRHATAMRVIAAIGAAMRQNLPLASALEAAAGAGQDKTSLICQRIALALADGNTLSTALHVGYPACPGHAAAMVAAAEPIGQLPRAIRALEADLAGKAIEQSRPQPIHPIYPVILLLFLLFVLTWLMVGVVPTFLDIFGYMGDELPAATIALVVGADIYRTFLVWPVIVAVLLGVPLGIYAMFRPRRPDRPRLLSQVGDFVKWHLPVLARFERNDSMLRAVEMVRLSLDAGCTVDDAIRGAATMDVNARYRVRLSQWWSRVLRGETVSEAARRSRVGEALAWAFDETINPGNAPAVLAAMESSCRARSRYQAAAARAVLWPCVLVAMGAAVGFIAYGLFSPFGLMYPALMSNLLP